MELSQKQKTFSEFFLHLLKLGSILKFINKEMTLMADVFLSLRTPKNVVR